MAAPLASASPPPNEPPVATGPKSGPQGAGGSSLSGRAQLLAGLKAAIRPTNQASVIEGVDAALQGEEQVALEGDHAPPAGVIKSLNGVMFSDLASGIAAFGEEWGELSRVTSKLSSTRFSDGEFLAPVQGAITSHFGEARSYEYGPAASPHQGADIAAASGTPVGASNGGVVVFADAWRIRGGAVVIDHGQGVFSGYYHLSTIQVALGQLVTKGDFIGTVGWTGLATASHLHWEIIVGGVHVDPFSWARLSGNEQAQSAALTDPRRPALMTIIDDELETDLLLAAETEQQPEAPSEQEAAVAEETAVEGALPPDEAAVPQAELQQPPAERLAAIRQLYIDMLGRDPVPDDAAGVQAWSDSGRSIEELRDRIRLDGVEERANAVAHMYIDVLGRDPRGTDDESIRRWAESDLTIPRLAEALVSAGATERVAAVRKLYQDVLRRDPLETDSAGLEGWAKSLLPLEAIRQELLSSPESQRLGPITAR